MKRIRVLVVDDSAFARKVVRELLSSAEDIEVVGTARDGVDALQKITELQPEVITLDLVMPELDGLGVLEALRGNDRTRAVIVSMSGAQTELGAAALLLGAVDLVHKPTALATNRLYEMQDELLAKVRAAAAAPRTAVRSAVLGRVPLPHPSLAVGQGIVVIGASTGGPTALSLVLSQLPKGLPWAVAAAIHLPVGYTDALASRLNAHSELEVLEAHDGVELKPGRVVLAQGGVHLEVAGTAQKPVGHLTHRSAMFYPSVDVLFESAAQIFGRRVLGVVLTGMGDDGLKGARAIHAAGGKVLAQEEASCVVYGMPRVIRENGLNDGGAELDGMAAQIVRHLPEAALA